jgi:hypothetical protein
MGLPARAFGVIFAVVAGQVLFGLLAAGALFAARQRAGKRVVIQIGLIIGLVESFVIAVGIAAANSARGGNAAITAGLLWYAGGGWTIVQFVIVYWIAWVWWKRWRTRR